MIDVTEVIIAILSALGSALAIWITKTVIPWIKARTSAEQHKVIQMLVSTAVYAAEQLYKGSHGPDKLAYVQQRLADAGVALDTKALTDMVEAEVYKLKIRQDWALTVAGELPGEE